MRAITDPDEISRLEEQRVQRIAAAVIEGLCGHDGLGATCCQRYAGHEGPHASFLYGWIMQWNTEPGPLCGSCESMLNEPIPGLRWDGQYWTIDQWGPL